MSEREPLRVLLTHERHATALASELQGVGEVTVHADRRGWEVVIRPALTRAIVARVLDGLRAALAGEATAHALVFVDGREYHYDA